MYSKHRLEALSDGIFAIAMTLLVLDIKLPANIPHGQLHDLLRASIPDWIAFLITFILAARYWVLQHQLFSLMEQVAPRTLATTFAFLAFITTLPFTTSLWGHSIREPLAFCIYFGDQAAIGIALLVEIEYGLLEHNLRLVEEMYSLRGRLYTMISAMTAAAIAALFLPIAYTGFVAAIIATIARAIGKYFKHRRLTRAV